MLTSAVEGVPFPGAVTVRVSGEVDLAEMDELCESIVACGDAVTPTVVVDLTDVTFMGSSGLRALIQARAKLDAEGYRLCVDGCSDTVEKLLDLTGLREHLPPSSALPAE